MPKQVDHDARRLEITAAVGRLAADRGLQGISFREVAAEAEMSVALVQHYVGTKEDLLVGSLEVHSAAVGALIAGRLAALDDDAPPMARVRTIAASFLALDQESRTAMVLYHAFAAAAITDPVLRSADAFRNASVLTSELSRELENARAAGHIGVDVDPEVEAQSLLALVLGLSLGVLLEQATPASAEEALDAHLRHLR